MILAYLLAGVAVTGAWWLAHGTVRPSIIVLWPLIVAAVALVALGHVLGGRERI